VESVDLNADLGEGLGAVEEDLLDLLSSASVACGGHTGDVATMHATVAAACARGVVVGAHPSYEDRARFGRRPIEVAPSVLVDQLRNQLAALDDVARSHRTRVRFVKAHGALYHRMGHDTAVADAVVDALDALSEPEDVVLLVAPGSVAAGRARDRGRRVASEAFADRAYGDDGTLLGRDRRGAVITDPTEVARRALSLALDGTVRSAAGRLLHLDPDSICLHGDTAGSLEIGRRVRKAIDAAGVTIAPFVDR
jgi:5-oxoprolinase (ATP-hydrolysing) subunit A